jgi:hypothetical protein
MPDFLEFRHFQAFSGRRGVKICRRGEVNLVIPY